MLPLHVTCAGDVPASLPRPKFTEIILVAILMAILSLTAALTQRNESDAKADAVADKKRN